MGTAKCETCGAWCRKILDATDKVAYHDVERDAVDLSVDYFEARREGFLRRERKMEDVEAGRLA